ncbi:unnamed protein product [Lampetra fluviatilis]
MGGRNPPVRFGVCQVRPGRRVDELSGQMSTASCERREMRMRRRRHLGQKQDEISRGRAHILFTSQWLRASRASAAKRTAAKARRCSSPARGSGHHERGAPDAPPPLELEGTPLVSGGVSSTGLGRCGHGW